MKIKLAKLWYAVPLMVFLLCDAVTVLIQRLTHLTIRSIPWQVLLWGTIVSSFILLIHIVLTRTKSILKKFLLMLLVVCGAGVIFNFAYLYGVFHYKPEYTVERNEIKMVARVHSFMDVSVYYHEFRGILFFDERKVGYEYYGNGGYDPFKRGNEPVEWWFEDFEGNLIEKGDIRTE